MPFIERIFSHHGELCARLPYEFIVLTLVFAACIASLNDGQRTPLELICGGCKAQERSSGTDLLVLTISRALAIIAVYSQLQLLRRLGSKVVILIAGLFSFFSLIIFASGVTLLIGSNSAAFYDSVPFFFLLIDIRKATFLGKPIISAHSKAEIEAAASRGMARFGPSMTLDMLVETLLIGLGTLTGIPRVSQMCCFGILCVASNYLVFMTVYPAVLSLLAEVCISHSQKSSSLKWFINLVKALDIEEFNTYELNSNPIITNVKIVMTFGLVGIHGLCQWLQPRAVVPVVSKAAQHNTVLLMSGFAVNVEHAIISVLMLALAGKFFISDWTSSVPGELLTQPLNSRFNKIFKIMEDSDDSPDEEYIPPSKWSPPLSRRRDSTLCLSESRTSIKERTLTECFAIAKSEPTGLSKLSDDEILALLVTKQIPSYRLEVMLDNAIRAVYIRRKLTEKRLVNVDLSSLPYLDYNYKEVEGTCCENIIGYMPVPVGVVGPLLIDDVEYYVPMSTTEGTLVASTNRGCRAITLGGGCRSSLFGDGMTRAPVVRLPNTVQAASFKSWVEQQENSEKIKHIFNSTSRFAGLISVQSAIAGRYIYLRFKSKTGDAMGMNMVSKGTEKVLSFLQEQFPDLEILSLSGNYCTDKKPSAINWIEGRGKSVVAEATIPANVVRDVLKTSVDKLVEVNISKNLIGSSLAGSVGGFNAQAANIVTAIYIATGQDPAQNVESSTCMTLMEKTEHGDLFISCTMPSLEVGTVGGGTNLTPQRVCLNMLGLQGSDPTEPGKNSRQLARTICCCVMAGELSLMSALTAGHLVKAHMQYNRSKLQLSST